MARSKSRTRKSVSKSPARVQKKAAAKTPKSEPKKNAKVASKSASRSRSASRARPAKKTTTPKSTKKSPSRSVSRSRAAVKTPAKTVSSAKTPSKSPSRTPAKVATKTPAKESIKSPFSNQRSSRSVERRRVVETVTPLRMFRNESSSRSPVKAKKESKCPWYPNFVCEYGKSGWNFCKKNSRDIIVSFILIIFIAALVHFIMYQDPAKLRANLQAFPAKVQNWAKGVYSSIRK